jgi:hypothetical protein
VAPCKRGRFQKFWKTENAAAETADFRPLLRLFGTFENRIGPGEIKRIKARPLGRNRCVRRSGPPNPARAAAIGQGGRGAGPVVRPAGAGRPGCSLSTDGRLVTGSRRRSQASRRGPIVKTIAEARLRLDAAMGDPAAVAELARQHALEERRMRQRVQHQVRLRMIQIEGETRVAMIRKEGERAKATNARIRRLEEQTALGYLNLRMDLARSDSRRGKGPIPLDLAQRWHDVTTEQSATITPAEAPLVPMWHAHADRLLREFQIECTWVREAAGINGYAFASVSRVEGRRSSPLEVTPSSSSKSATSRTRAGPNTGG